MNPVESLAAVLPRFLFLELNCIFEKNTSKLIVEYADGLWQLNTTAGDTKLIIAAFQRDIVKAAVNIMWETYLRWEYFQDYKSSNPDDTECVNFDIYWIAGKPACKCGGKSIMVYKKRGWLGDLNKAFICIECYCLFSRSQDKINVDGITIEMGSYSDKKIYNFKKIR